MIKRLIDLLLFRSPPPVNQQDAPAAAPRAYAAPPATPAAPTGRPGKKTLAGVVGIATASLLFVSIPADESGRQVDATVAADGTATIRHISGRQYLKVYLDIVGVATACDGITTYQGRPLRKGMAFTEEQCTEMLEEELIKHAEGVMRCTAGLALTIPNVDHERFAAVSLAYNVGVGRAATAKRKGAGYCGSTVARRFNERRYREGCDALLMWNKAGGRAIQGLTNRRKRERTVCLRPER